MEGKRLLHKIRLTNLLSYGSDSKELELEPLNVLIGPNSTGKSNLIEAIGLLQALPSDLLRPIRRGGGSAEWLWKGGPADAVARIETVVALPGDDRPLRYGLGFTSAGPHLEIREEVIGPEPSAGNSEEPFYRYDPGRGIAHLRPLAPGAERNGPRIPGGVAKTGLLPTQSVLAQLKDPYGFPEMTALGKQFEQIRIYSDWDLGRHADMRRPPAADLPGDFLEEDASNLGLVLNDLLSRPDVERVLVEKLQQVYEDLEDVSARVVAGTVQILCHERGQRTPMPAARLSDGTLRFLCLLTILCHPAPPPLVCIENPELGLHMDIVPTVAELLVDAAQRTQLVVTTHSDILVTELAETPEAVIVCERDSGGTYLERLDPAQIKVWLDEGTLGDLWRMGELGGRRW
jgi:predicted ATPase